jgi:hypothetical protein
MGFELVYCYKCQKRLIEDDFKEGAALRVGTHTSCLSCADELLQQLTPEQQKAVFASSKFTVSSKKPQESTRIEKPGRAPTVHEQAPEEPPPDEGKKKPVALIAGGAIAALILILVLVLSLRGGSKPPPGPGAGGGASAGAGTGAPVDPKRAQEALDALRKARAFERENPGNHTAIIRLFDETVKLAEGTPHAEEARRGRDEAETRFKAVIGSDIAQIEKEIRTLADTKAYQKALDRLEAARKRHEAPEWGSTVDRMTKEIWDAASGNFVRIKSKAVDCAQLGKPDEVKTWREEVATWGVQKYLDELDKAVAEAAPGATPVTAGGGTPPPAVPATAEAGTIGPFELDGAGFVRNWLLAGAFPDPNNTGLRFDFIGEASCRPAQGLEVKGVDGTQARWACHQSPGERVVFPDVRVLDWSRGRDAILVYATCWLESDGEKDIELRVGSDDGYRLWLGGKRIREVREKRRCERDRDRIPVRLSAGKQLVLLKVYNIDAGFEMMLRVTTSDGQRAPGVKVWN